MNSLDFSQVHNQPLILQQRTCPARTLPSTGDWND